MMFSMLAKGIIPAYAGNTSSPYRLSTAWTGSSPHTRGTRRWSARLRLRCWDHPRIRGEHRRAAGRGARCGGIIPAYAGNTATDVYQAFFTKDHPRIRGEHDGREHRDDHDGGIIPAYAGNTVKLGAWKQEHKGSSPHTRGTRKTWCRRREGRWDHPRIRGEHSPSSRAQISVMGIIPAYAGNTSPVSAEHGIPTGSSPHTRGTPTPLRASTAWAWDHPRIRGEHARQGHALRERVGIIPAYAGNTRMSSWMLTSIAGSSPHTRGTRQGRGRIPHDRGDHPRIRGEHFRSHEPTLSERGIIPAYAGNTHRLQGGESPLRGSSPHTRGTQAG